MDINALVSDFQIFNHLLAILVGMPRLFMIVQTVPFMGGSIVTGQLRFTVVFACYMVLHPAIVAQLPPYEGSLGAVVAQYGLIIIKESLIGFLIGYLAGIMFWTFQCAGFFIDNQRGASQATDTDPLAGEETSPLGSLLFQGATYLFFSTGAFLTFLGLVYSSYELWPVTSLLPMNVFADMRLPLFFAGKVSWLATQMMLLAGPIIVACLLTDVSLGLINRFASQLNVYVLSMPIKSAVAAFLLLLYFGVLMSGAVGMFGGIGNDMRQLKLFMP